MTHLPLCNRESFWEKATAGSSGTSATALALGLDPGLETPPYVQGVKGTFPSRPE